MRNDMVERTDGDESDRDSDGDGEVEVSVKLPLKSKYHCLSVNNEQVLAWDGDENDYPGGISGGQFYLPPAANALYWRHANNDVTVYGCRECGYLTQSKKAGAGSMDPYECGNCGGTGFRPVYPRERVALTVKEGYVDEVFIDVPTLDAEDVPNHPSHFGRIKNNAENGIYRPTMLDRVADILRETRHPAVFGVSDTK